MQYIEIFLDVKIGIFIEKKIDIFLIFAQNIDCEYTLEPPPRVPTIYVLEQKIRKIGIPLQTPVFLYKIGV